jgi:hypothetical protein
MLDRLYNLGDVPLLALFAGAAFVVFLAVPLIGHRLGWTAGDKDLDYVGRAQMTLASLAAVILSFSLVQVDGTQRRTAELVERESAQIDYCDRLMLRYGQIEAAELRPLLRGYAESVINDEWPALQVDRSSERTAERLTALTVRAAALDPAPGRQATVYADLLRAVDGLADYRAQRLGMAHARLPDTFWYMNLGLVVLMLGLGLMMPPTPHQISAGVARGLAVALLAGVVFTIDTPLKGDTALTPAAIERTLAVLRARG